MILYRSNQGSWTHWVVRCAFLGVAIAGCSATRDSGKSPGPDPGPTAQTAPSSAADPPSNGVNRGKQLLGASGCTACHVVNGQGGTAGPDLSNEADKGRSRQWLRTQIRSPKENAPQSIMPPYGNLSDTDVTDLVDYLLSLSAAKTPSAIGGRTAVTGRQFRPQASAASSSDIAEGGQMWAQICGRCHNLRPPSQYSDAQWQVAVYHMRVKVPLTGEQQRKILEFLQAKTRI